jgi:hypothetical protein
MAEVTVNAAAASAALAKPSQKDRFLVWRPQVRRRLPFFARLRKRICSAKKAERGINAPFYSFVLIRLFIGASPRASLVCTHHI